MITLEQLLESRDRRAAHQRQLLDAHPGRVLLCLTVQLPGSVKRNQLSLAIARAGVEAVREAFVPEYEELRDLETGYEGYFLVPMDPLEAKRRACQLEDSHPLGRLMDLDVLVSAASARPAAFEKGMEICSTPCIEAIGREDIGLEPRRCLLCAQPARLCMRAHSHTQEELLAKIEEMVKSYLKL